MGVYSNESAKGGIFGNKILLEYLGKDKELWKNAILMGGSDKIVNFCPAVKGEGQASGIWLLGKDSDFLKDIQPRCNSTIDNIAGW